MYSTGSCLTNFFFFFFPEKPRELVVAVAESGSSSGRRKTLNFSLFRQLTVRISWEGALKGKGPQRAGHSLRAAS